MKISIIIVSYNTRRYLEDCLRSLEADTSAGYAEIIVVDNGSHDDSIALVRAQFPQARVIETGENLGFARANNLGLSIAQGEYILFLNSDTVVKPGALGAMARFLDAHPDAAVVGPRLVNADGSRQLSCYKFPNPARAWRDNLGVTALLASHPRWGDFRRWAHDSVRIVDFVIGAALLVRKTVIDQVGGLDDGFFMYFEEIDWCFRMTQAGQKIYFTPEAEVVHYGGGSGKEMAERVFAEFSGSHRLYFQKHFGAAGARSLRASLIAGALVRIPLSGIGALLGRGNAREEARVWRDILRWNLGLWQTPGLRPETAYSQSAPKESPSCSA